MSDIQFNWDYKLKSFNDPVLKPFLIQMSLEYTGHENWFYDRQYDIQGEVHPASWELLSVVGALIVFLCGNKVDNEVSRVKDVHIEFKNRLNKIIKESVNE